MTGMYLHFAMYMCMSKPTWGLANKQNIFLYPDLLLITEQRAPQEELGGIYYNYINETN
jgi:hypothetical protein